METQKASERTRHHLNSPGAINQVFSSMTDMEEKAANIVKRHLTAIEKEKEKEKENGFDIDDQNSVNSFKIDYTPWGSSVLLKEIKKENKEGELTLLDSKLIQTEYIVIVAGLLAEGLNRGDIVILGSPQDTSGVASKKLKIQGVTFLEVSSYAIGGIFINKETLASRVNAKL